jgi:hypothetical protein
VPRDTRTPDGVITRITEAGSAADALTIMKSVPHGLLIAVADQLHISPHGHADPWIRRAIVAEARA